MKILIIKLGFSETLDSEIGRVSSLGDVLRTTPILLVLKEKYPNSKIIWLVDQAPYPLLKDNEYIDEILIWDSFVGFQLMCEKFDIVINLEKIAGLCAITNKIDAWKKYGFRLDGASGSYSVFEGSEYAFELCNQYHTKQTNDKFWQEVLIEMIGGEWRRQSYVLGYKPKTKIEFDVGFNYKVGLKFVGKSWNDANWNLLESALKSSDFSVSWQQGLNDLYEYIDWINSCSILITCDSLGLHIAIALNKPVIALFGPTNSREVFMHSFGFVIQKNTMDEISPDEVFKKIVELKNIL